MFSITDGLVGAMIAKKLMEEQFRMPDLPEEAAPPHGPEENRPKRLKRVAILRLPQLLRLAKIVNR